MIGSVACRTAPSLASLTAAAREELAVSIEVFQKVADHPVMAAGLVSMIFSSVTQKLLRNILLTVDNSLSFYDYETKPSYLKNSKTLGIQSLSI